MLKNDLHWRKMRNKIKKVEMKKMNKNSFYIINMQIIVDFVQNRRIIKKNTMLQHCGHKKPIARGRRRRDELEKFL